MPPSPARPTLHQRVARFGRSVARVHYGRLALALALGSAGGYLLDRLQLPLAWMIGSMLATTVAALARAPVEVPSGLRSGMIVIVGVLLGASFRPEFVEHVGEWSVSLAFLVLYILAAVALGLLFLRRVARYDAATAYFTAAPGGFNEMVIIGGSVGGDERAIALAHTFRVIVVVMTIPLWFQLLGLYEAGDRPPMGPDLLDVLWKDYLLLAACALGAPVAYRLKIPAATLIGPMVASAAIHLAGLTDTRPPATLIAAAQVVIGAYVGCRFVGTRLAELRRVLASGLVLAAMLLVLTVVFAFGVQALTDLEASALVLAYAPGGLAEMSLVALALQTDPAFVATHHVVRIVLIVMLAPAVFLFYQRRQARRLAAQGGQAGEPAAGDEGR